MAPFGYNGTTWDRLRSSAIDTGRQIVLTDNKNNVAANVGAAASLSAEIDVGTGRIVGIRLPADIGGATVMTFQSSSTSGGTFQDVYDEFGVEFRINNIVNSRDYKIDATMFLGDRYIKIRYGTAASPTVYGSARNGFLKTV